MAVTRTHFAFRIDLWTSDGASIVEHLAGVENYQIALATYRAASGANYAARKRNASYCCIRGVLQGGLRVGRAGSIF